MNESDSTRAKLRAINNASIANMPTEALQAIYLATQAELTRRRQMTAVSRKAVMESNIYKRMDREKHKFSKHMLKELDAVMAQDWSHLFTDGDQEPKYYVYAHVHQMSGKSLNHQGQFPLSLSGPPFYIGKGTGRRAWDLKRNEGHGVQLRQLLASGSTEDSIVKIIRDNLTEREALEIESKLIYFFGTKFETSRRGLLVNLDFPKRPF